MQFTSSYLPMFSIDVCMETILLVLKLWPDMIGVLCEAYQRTNVANESILRVWLFISESDIHKNMEYKYSMQKRQSFS